MEKGRVSLCCLSPEIMCQLFCVKKKKHLCRTKKCKMHLGCREICYLRNHKVNVLRKVCVTGSEQAHFDTFYFFVVYRESTLSPPRGRVVEHFGACQGGTHQCIRPNMGSRQVRQTGNSPPKAKPPGEAAIREILPPVLKAVIPAVVAPDVADFIPSFMSTMEVSVRVMIAIPCIP